MLNNFWAMYLPAMEQIARLCRGVEFAARPEPMPSNMVRLENRARLDYALNRALIEAGIQVALPVADRRRSQSSATLQPELRTEAAERDEQRGYVRRGDIAVVPVMGPIEKRGSWLSEYFGFCSTLQIQTAVESAANEPDIDAIVLLCDSPGGSVDGLADCADAIFAARAKKRIVTHVQGMCASAAYWLCSQAHEMWTGRMDLVGSIGTLSVVYDWSKAFEAEGIRTVVMSTGKYKGVGVLGAPVTDDHEREFQRIVDTYFADFTAAIARGRGLAEGSVKESADGKIFFADEAKARRLIDGTRTLAETLAAVKTSKTEPGRKTEASRRRLDLLSH